MVIKVGDQLPDVELFYVNDEGAPTKVSLRSLFEGKKGILVGVPGAFTPGCTKTHLPGYVADYQKIKDAGADIVVLITVNDPFVAKAWSDAAGAEGKVLVLADPAAVATKALGTEWPASEAILGSLRSVRYSAIVNDNIVKVFNLEEGGALTCSLSNQIIGQLKDA